jgi:hypothetical protein
LDFIHLRSLRTIARADEITNVECLLTNSQLTHNTKCDLRPLSRVSIHLAQILRCHASWGTLEAVFCYEDLKTDLQSGISTRLTNVNTHRRTALGKSADHST